jgi:hypothetical protein
LELTAAVLRINPAPRNYRAAFPSNYQEIFPDQGRNYRVDILKASVEQYATIWVNGDKFEVSAEAMRRAQVLQRAWTTLGSVLETVGQPRETTSSTRSLLRSGLAALDATWASFEQKYVTELIEIEEKARDVIVQAIEHERSLQKLEAQGLPADSVQACLVSCVSRLNSVANTKRKGRSDLDVHILSGALRALRRCDADQQHGVQEERLDAVRLLATDVVDSFSALRFYFTQVGSVLDEVDPHLCNNQGLAARLRHWEESWEVGARYVQNAAVLGAVGDLVAELRAAQRVAPELKAMCEECSVELFTVLPRLLWLRFLAAPAQHLELFRTLLPHRFTAKGAGGAAQRSSTSPIDWEDDVWNAELRALGTRFCDSRRLLQAAVLENIAEATLEADGVTPDAEQVTWEIFVRRAVSGTDHKEVYACLSTSGGTGPTVAASVAQEAVESLAHELERWSMELQRHCPEDWNQCSAVLIRCLTGRKERPMEIPFCV